MIKKLTRVNLDYETVITSLKENLNKLQSLIFLINSVLNDAIKKTLIKENLESIELPCDPSHEIVITL